MLCLQACPPLAFNTQALRSYIDFCPNYCRCRLKYLLILCELDSWKIPNRLIRVVLIITGTFFVGLGILGIFLPLLPTTPFLLLAAACYARSSKRFYNWLLNNKWFGNYIKNYRDGKGVPLKVMVLSISLLWITIIFSAVF